MPKEKAAVGWVAFGLVKLVVFVFIVVLRQRARWWPWVKGFQKASVL